MGNILKGNFGDGGDGGNSDFTPKELLETILEDVHDDKIASVLISVETKQGGVRVAFSAQSAGDILIHKHAIERAISESLETSEDAEDSGPLTH